MSGPRTWWGGIRWWPWSVGRMAFAWWAMVLVASLSLGGCASQEDPNTPPVIRYGEDVCTSCGMIISDPSHAAAYRTTNGEVRLFDDVGEMVLYHRDHREAVVAFFVHDYHSQTWLRAEKAYYVSSQNLRTPMGVGIVALASEADARSLASHLGGEVFTFGQLLERPELAEVHGHAGH